MKFLRLENVVAPALVLAMFLAWQFL